MVWQTYLDKSHDQPRINVPFDMAMEQPQPWVIALEAHHDMPVRPDQQDVPAHRLLWQHQAAVDHSVGVIVARVVVSANDGLEIVPVQMEGMFAGVVVVHDNLDDLVFA
jgi:hypothetical protein